MVVEKGLILVGWSKGTGQQMGFETGCEGLAESGQVGKANGYFGRRSLDEPALHKLGHLPNTETKCEK